MSFSYCGNPPALAATATRRPTTFAHLAVRIETECSRQNSQTLCRDWQGPVRLQFVARRRLAGSVLSRRIRSGNESLYFSQHLALLLPGRCAGGSGARQPAAIGAFGQPHSGFSERVGPSLIGLLPEPWSYRPR